MKNKLFIALGIVCAIAILGSWYYLSSLYEEKENLYQTNQLINSNLIKREMQVNDLKDSITQLKDSIFALQVQKGQVEIELNRSSTQILNLIKGYKEAKTINDTIMQLKNCDSLIVQSIPDYAAINRIRNAIIDSLLSKQENVIDLNAGISIRNDSTIADLKKENEMCIKKNEKLEKKARKSVKFGLWASLGAAVLFVIAILK